MEDTRSPNQQTDAGSTCDVAICGSGIATRLLVSKCNEPDAQIDCLFCDVHHGDTNKPKNYNHSEISKGTGNYLGARRWRHLGPDNPVNCCLPQVHIHGAQARFEGWLRENVQAQYHAENDAI